MLKEPVLFDDAFIETLPELKTFSNPGVVMMCRHLHRFREKVELWYSRFDEKSKKDMYARLRSLDDWVHMPALHELWAHELCLSHNWHVVKNPDVNGLTPDYLVQISKNESFYLEVASVFPPANAQGPQREVNALLDKLNALEVPFLLAFQLNEWPSGSVSPGKVARNIEHKLKLALNRGVERETIDLSEYGLSGRLIAIHSPSCSQAMVSFQSPVQVGFPNVSTMLSALKSKINRYKNMERPFLVAICSTDLIPVNKQTLESILFGEEKIIVDLKTHEASVARDNSGILPPKPGKEPLNTRLSGVLFVETERVDDNLILRTLVLPNKWARLSLPENVLELDEK